jgi:hypothetical protein
MTNLTKATIKKLEEMGATFWEKGDMRRLYLNEAGEKMVGLTYTTYNSGSISSAKLGGEEITNAHAGRVLSVLSELYYDMIAEKWLISKPRFVKSYDYDKIKGTVVDALKSMLAEIAE